MNFNDDNNCPKKTLKQVYLGDGLLASKNDR